jgi:hypothetical protein
MNWPGRFAVAAVVLALAALAIPVLVSPGWQYHYDITAADNHYADLSEESAVEYDALSAAERGLFQQLLETNGTVTLDEVPEGDHLNTGSDETALTAVDYGGRLFAVESYGDRENFTTRYWGPPVLFVLATLAAVLGTVSLGVGKLRGRLSRR